MRASTSIPPKFAGVRSTTRRIPTSASSVRTSTTRCTTRRARCRPRSSPSLPRREFRAGLRVVAVHPHAHIAGGSLPRGDCTSTCPGGRALLTLYVWNQESRELVAQGKSALPFRPHDDLIVITPFVPEAAIALPQEDWDQAVRDAGLEQVGDVLWEAGAAERLPLPTKTWLCCVSRVTFVRHSCSSAPVRVFTTGAPRSAASRCSPRRWVRRPWRRGNQRTSTPRSLRRR